MPVSSVTEHWIKPDAVTINLNHFGDPDYLQVSVLAGAVVMAFKQDVIAYNAAHNYRTWPLQAANTYLETASAYNVYARLTRSEVNASALIVYDPILRDIEGRPIYLSEDGTEILGEADPAYFYVFLGQISSSIGSSGQSTIREWTVDFRFGSLDTSQYRNEESGGEWQKMFRLNKVTDMIDVLRTFSSAVFKKFFIGEKEIQDIKRSMDISPEGPFDDMSLPTTLAVRKMSDDIYLSKIKDDRTSHSLGVGKSLEVGGNASVGGNLSVGMKGIFGEKITAKKGLQIGTSFIPGILTGSGGFFDEFANGEVESLIIRRFLEVPELRFNRVEIKLGDKWNAPGAGIFESVEPDYDEEGNILSTGTGYLKLEEGEYGAIAVGDICMGIFHSMNASENATEDSDDSRGNFQFAGFYTCYFIITEITGKDNKQFRYQMRPVSDRWKLTYHPSEAMTFVCYGSFTREDRQTSVYTTRTYTRLLKNQNTWEISASNIAMQYGNMENMSIHGLDMKGYSMYLNNIYMTGVLKQVKPDGSPVNVANEREEWVGSEDYGYHDRVSHNGSLWLCVNENGTDTEPKKGNSDWLLQVVSGASLSAEGRFNSSNAPYQPNSVVEFADKVWINTEVTSNAPFGCWTDNNGNRLLFNDGGFILSDETKDDAWQVLLDISNFTDGEDGEGLVVQYSSDKQSWHDTFVEDSDIYMRQKVGENGTWSAPMRIVGEDGQAKEGIYTDFQFAVGTSLTVAPTTGWQDGPPTVGLGQFLWMRVRVVNPSDGTSTSWEVTRIGGEKGNQGDSISLGGDYKTGATVKYITIVRMGGKSWSAKKDTTNPPMWCWTDNDGNRLLFNDGGYALTGSVNTDEYQEVASDGTNGKDGKDGKDGLQGIQGCVIRDSEWASGVEYHNDEGNANGYIDVVLVRDNSTTTGWVAYKCKKTHTSSSSITPTNTTYWEEFSANVSTIFTSLIIAKNAKITFLQGNQLLMQNSSGVIKAGLSGSEEGSKTRIWAGSQNPDSAPFRVNEEGEAWITNAHVSGEITATSGKIGGFKITETSLYVGDEVISNPTSNVGMLMSLNSSGIKVDMLGMITARTEMGLKRVSIADYQYLTSLIISHNQSLVSSTRMCGLKMDLQNNDIAIYVNGGSTHILSSGITKLHGLVLNKKAITYQSQTISENDDIITFNATSDITIVLPSTIPVGKVLYLKNVGSKKVSLTGYIRLQGESNYGDKTVNIGASSYMAIKTDVAWTLFNCG